MADGAALVEVPTAAGAATLVTWLSRPFLQSFKSSDDLSFLFAPLFPRERVIARLGGLLSTHWRIGGLMLTR